MNCSGLQFQGGIQSVCGFLRETDQIKKVEWKSEFVRKEEIVTFEFVENFFVYTLLKPIDPRVAETHSLHKLS